MFPTKAFLLVLARSLSNSLLQSSLLLCTYRRKAYKSIAAQCSLSLPFFPCVHQTIDKTSKSFRGWEGISQSLCVCLLEYLLCLAACQICRCLQKRPHRYQAMFVKRCQYLLYYKSYVDLSTTTLITLGLKLVYNIQHRASNISSSTYTKWAGYSTLSAMCVWCVWVSKCVYPRDLSQPDINVSRLYESHHCRLDSFVFPFPYTPFIYCDEATERH